MNASYEQKIAALIAEITAAFDGVSREDGVTLHEAQVLDDCGSAKKRVKARAKDTETRWQDVPPQDIEYGSSCLSFLDSKGFRYYIPAFMLWLLKYQRTRNREIPTYENAISFLMWPDAAHRKAQCALLTKTQSKSIAGFLMFWAEDGDEDAQEALDAYWGQFL